MNKVKIPIVDKCEVAESIDRSHDFCTKTKHLNTKCFNDPKHTTKIDNKGNPCWYKRKTNKDGKFDKKGVWDKKSYICSACYAGGGISHPTLNRDDFNTRLEYANARAQRLGFKNEADYAKRKRWDRGVQRPMEEAKDCSVYFGVCIGEKYVSQTFDNPEMMLLR